MLKILLGLRAALAAYLRENPGTVSLVVGWLVIGLAHFGLKVDASQMASIVAILLPLIVGGHLAARHARANAKGKALAAKLAGPPVVLPDGPFAAPVDPPAAPPAP